MKLQSVHCILVACALALLRCAPVHQEPTATIPVGKGPDAIYLSACACYLYVANVEDTTLSIIDPGSHQVIRTLTVPSGPWGFARLKDKQVALSSYSGAVTIIHETDMKVLRIVRLPFKAGGIVAAPDRTRLYVVAVEKNAVAVVDVASGRVLAMHPTGSGPDGIGISPDGAQLYVACTKQGTIEVVATDTGKTIHRFPVGGKPELVHSSHDGRLLLVSNFTNGKVHVIDVSARRVVREIEGIKGTEEAVMSPDGTRVYVAAFTEGRVRSFRAADGREVGRPLITGKKPIGILPTKEKLFVTNYGDNTVSVYSLPAQK